MSALAERPMSRNAGIVALLFVSVSFASNHVAARIAFDHGVNVPTAVVVRSVATALAVLLLLKFSGVSLALPAGRRLRALGIGLLMVVQSLCLYSSVARIPVALALLAFNTYPLLLALMSWASGGERPTRRTLLVMPVVLVGLALALDVVGRLELAGAGVGDAPVSATEALLRRWAIIGPGVGFALGASLSFGLALLLTTRWLGGVDGRLRTVMFMTVVAVVTAIGIPLAAAAGVDGARFAFPVDAPGWLGLVLLSLLYGSAITGAFVVLPRIGTVNNAAVMNFEPIAALGIGWLVLGQTVAPMQLLGALIVVGGIVALSWR